MDDRDPHPAVWGAMEQMEGMDSPFGAGAHAMPPVLPSDTDLSRTLLHNVQEWMEAVPIQEVRYDIVEVVRKTKEVQSLLRGHLPLSLEPQHISSALQRFATFAVPDLRADERDAVFEGAPVRTDLAVLAMLYGSNMVETEQPATNLPPLPPGVVPLGMAPMHMHAAVNPGFSHVFVPLGAKEDALANQMGSLQLQRGHGSMSSLSSVSSTSSLGDVVQGGLDSPRSVNSDSSVPESLSGSSSPMQSPRE